MDENFKNQYQELLYQYLLEIDEHQLFHAQQFSKKFIENNISPEEALLFHLHSMKKKYDLPLVWEESFKFFLEFMVQYGLAYQKREALLSDQKQMEAELSLAESVQHSLLPDRENILLPKDVDLGIVSVAARKVSGDFYNINTYDQGVDIAVADVAGKSIPAAMIMSMMQFVMESIEDCHQPHTVLELLNRYLYKKSEASMFVTMFWGDYHAPSSHFYYSNAGHEPALFYQAKEERFVNLSTDGCALGLTTRYGFKTESVHLEPGDFILLYTDGVIETRDSEKIDDNEILQCFLRQINFSQNAQQIVEQLHQQIIGINGLNIPDDQTILLFRKLS
jgi:sigma-B regulation protein RsbU (phosphoserine phosphatase)